MRAGIGSESPPLPLFFIWHFQAAAAKASGSGISNEGFNPPEPSFTGGKRGGVASVTLRESENSVSVILLISMRFRLRLS